MVAELKEKNGKLDNGMKMAIRIMKSKAAMEDAFLKFNFDKYQYVVNYDSDDENKKNPNVEIIQHNDKDIAPENRPKIKAPKSLKPKKEKESSRQRTKSSEINNTRGSRCTT